MGILVTILGSSTFPLSSFWMNLASQSHSSVHSNPQDQTFNCALNPRLLENSVGTQRKFVFPPNNVYFKVISKQWNSIHFKEISRWKNLDRCLWGFKIQGCLFKIRGISLTMDPSWSDIEIILQRHEDMAEGSRLIYNQVDNEVNGHEQIILALLHRVETLEQERKTIVYLEQVVGTLIQHVDDLEHEYQHIRAIFMPQ
jgi:hypothetical protein